MSPESIAYALTMLEATNRRDTIARTEHDSIVAYGNWCEYNWYGVSVSI